ncbi:MAG: ATP-binding cassette domain-containing protein, partial [Candidatus Omnitrophota bacterium]
MQAPALAEKARDKIIEVKALSAGYGGNLVFDRISFDIQRGEIFVILGGSGCGKSTMLKHIIGLYKPMAGEILIEGKEMVKAEGRERLDL